MSVTTAKKAAGLDLSIVGIVLAISVAASFFFISTIPEYQNPVDVSTEVLLVTDFVADYSFSGATLEQDALTGDITAFIDGNLVAEIPSNYLDLVVVEGEEKTTYSLVERTAE
jgi:hypothetical protein